MPMFDVCALSKAYLQHGQRIEAIDSLSLHVRDREFVSIVGPSGAGKTTLLRCLAGILPPDDGTITLNTVPIAKPTAEVGMVFQDFSLFPWLTVRQNIAFGLEAKRVPPLERSTIVDRLLRQTGLIDMQHFYPKSLSGGMKQRVAVARTLANNPSVILMDEPFGALDSLTRESMQEFLTRLWEQDQKTVVFVTHDIEEALFLSDTVHVLTARPARIRHTFDIPFARPREHSLKHTKEFFEMKMRVLDVLEGPEQVLKGRNPV